MAFLRPDDRYSNDIDPDTKRTPESAPAGHIKSLISASLGGSADYLKTVNIPLPTPGHAGMPLYEL